MTTHHLDSMLRPTRLAVIGASETAGSIGQALMAKVIGAGFPGDVFPVNPKCSPVPGLPAYPHGAGHQAAAVTHPASEYDGSAAGGNRSPAGAEGIWPWRRTI